MPIHRLNDISVEPEDYFVAPEKLIAGNPQQTVWVQYTDPSGKFCAGVWQSEPGKWRINYSEEEVCRMLSGHSVITDDAGIEMAVRVGDSFVIPRGFSGTWEVVTTTRKTFVIYEAGG